jgi:hypothetical protein
MRAHKLVALVFAGLLIAAAPSASAPVDAATTANGEPRAAAWAISTTLGSAGQVLQVGSATASSGSRPSATGAAFLVGDQGTGVVTADLDHPDVSKDVQDFQDPSFPVCIPIPVDNDNLPKMLCDPGGSINLRGGFAEAHASNSSSSSQAGIGSGTGNGFAFASKNFSFEQQSTALNAVQQVDDATFGQVINPLIDMLNQTQNVVGLPDLVGIPPAGLIDIADSGAVSGRAQTSAAPGYNSASASASLGDLKLLGGFIELHGVTADALSQSNSGSDSRTASSKIGSMTIAGLSVVGDDTGLHAIGKDVLLRQAAQTELDMVLGALQKAGMTIAVAQTKATGDIREASALEITISTPQGIIQMSIGHAEASAATASGPIIPVGGSSFPPPVGGVVPPTVSGVTQPPSIGPPTAPVPPATTTGHGPVVRSLGPAAARALRTVYLIFLVGGFIGALMYPMLIRRAPQLRRRPLLV